MTVQISYDHAVKLQCCIKIGKSEKIILFNSYSTFITQFLSVTLFTDTLTTFRAAIQSLVAVV